MSAVYPKPNQLVNDSGEVIYRNPFTTTLTETLADFKIHLEHGAGLSSRVPVHHMLVREIDQVLSDPRVVSAQQFQRLGEQLTELHTAGDRAGRLAFLRPSRSAREHQIHERRSKQLALIAGIGTDEDPIAIARIASDLGEIRNRLVFRGQHLRTTQMRSEVSAQPPYLTELLGSRPESGNLRLVDVWQTAAEKLVGRRIDLGVSGDTDLGFNLERDHALARTISNARQALGLGTPDRGAHAGIGI